MFGPFPIESTLVGKDVQKRPAPYLNAARIPASNQCQIIKRAVNMTKETKSNRGNSSKCLTTITD